MSSKKKKNCFLGFLKQIDYFGYPISLQYKDDANFKSVAGGFVSILVCLAFLAFFSSEVY